jgi:hypothetical protein
LGANDFYMKTIFLLIGFLACVSSTYADMLGINIEFSCAKHGQTSETLVSIRAGPLISYNRDNVTVAAAAKVLRDLKFNMDAKFAVIYSKGPISMTDLMPIFEAMSANNIEPAYVQIGSNPPTGMDIWNHK